MYLLHSRPSRHHSSAGSKGTEKAHPRCSSTLHGHRSRSKEEHSFRSVRRQVEILNGLFNIDTGKYFLVNIELPIDKELCYADFTN